MQSSTAQARRIGNINGSRSRAARGFTLIELLTVIAIIGILTAIILPVFARLQENAREGNTMAHMHEIDSGLALYKLDNKSYPPVLFAYACDSHSTDGCNTADTMATIAGDGNAKNELAGLYPEYVQDWHTFTCANDPVNDPQGAGHTDSTVITPNFIQTDGTLKPADGTANRPYRAFFYKDAFDLNPQVQSNGNLVANSGHPNVVSTYKYMIRYQTAWTSWDGNYTDPASEKTTPTSDFGIEYQRQLMWQNPPANTYVTGITDHVTNANKLMVLFVSGTVQKVSMQLGGAGHGGWDDGYSNSSQNIAPTASVIACTTATGGTGSTPACSQSSANFWKFDPARLTNPAY